MPDLSTIVKYALSVGNKSGAIPAAPQGILKLKESIEGLPFELLTKSMSGILDPGVIQQGIQQLAQQMGGLQNLGGQLQSILGQVTAGTASVQQIVQAVGGVTSMTAGLNTFLGAADTAVISALSPGTANQFFVPVGSTQPVPIVDDGTFTNGLTIPGAPGAQGAGGQTGNTGPAGPPGPSPNTSLFVLQTDLAANLANYVNTAQFAAGTANNTLFLGGIVANQYAFANQATIAFGYEQCRLQLVSTNLVLSPFNGNLLLINGTPRVVPDAGVSLAATGLTATTLYYIYAFINSGTMTLEASTTAYVISTTTGNKGTVIKNGDDTRTLVGMARPVSGPAWAYSKTQRFVRSWFNDNGIATITSPVLGTRSTTSSVFPTMVELDTSYRNEILIWAGEDVQSNFNVTAWNSLTTAAVYSAIAVDGSTQETGGGSFHNSPSAGFAETHTGNVLKSGLSEGYHYVTLVGAVSSGTGTWSNLTADLVGSLAARTIRE